MRGLTAFIAATRPEPDRPTPPEPRQPGRRPGRSPTDHQFGGWSCSASGGAAVGGGRPPRRPQVVVGAVGRVDRVDGDELGDRAGRPALGHADHRALAAGDDHQRSGALGRDRGLGTRSRPARRAPRGRSALPGSARPADRPDRRRSPAPAPRRPPGPTDGAARPAAAAGAVGRWSTATSPEAGGRVEQEPIRSGPTPVARVTWGTKAWSSGRSSGPDRSGVVQPTQRRLLARRRRRRPGRRRPRRVEGLRAGPSVSSSGRDRRGRASAARPARPGRPRPGR